MSQTTTGVADEQMGTADLTDSERYSLLTARRRRLALEILAERSSPVELPDLAAEVAAREDGLDATDEDAVRRVKITLCHVHLPKLTDSGVVDYNGEAYQLDA